MVRCNPCWGRVPLRPIGAVRLLGASASYGPCKPGAWLTHGRRLTLLPSCALAGFSLHHRPGRGRDGVRCTVRPAGNACLGPGSQSNVQGAPSPSDIHKNLSPVCLHCSAGHTDMQFVSHRRTAVCTHHGQACRCPWRCNYCLCCEGAEVLCRECYGAVCAWLVSQQQPRPRAHHVAACRAAFSRR